MLTTNNNQILNFEVSDSSVYVSPGCALVGNYVMSFRGGSMPFASMVTPDFLASPNYYQYSVLSLCNFYGFPDMTATTTSSVASEEYLKSPVFDVMSTGFNVPTDATITPHMHQIPAREMRPIGLFLFTNDGTNIIHKSSSRII